MIRRHQYALDHCSPKVGPRAAEYLWRGFVGRFFALVVLIVMGGIVLIYNVSHSTPVLFALLALVPIPIGISIVIVRYRNLFEKAAADYLRVDRKKTRGLRLTTPNYERWCERNGVNPESVHFEEEEPEHL